MFAITVSSPDGRIWPQGDSRHPVDGEVDGFTWVGALVLRRAGVVALARQIAILASAMHYEATAFGATRIVRYYNCSYWQCLPHEH